MARAGTRGIVPLLALGATLARRGILPVLAMAISALTAVVLVVFAVVLARRGPEAPVHDVPLLASSALAWGGGFLHAFGASAHALRRDRAEGIRALLHARAATVRGYILARVGGLAVVLALTVGGGTLLAGVASALLAGGLSAVPRTLQATLAGVAFSLAFASVIAPVAIAAVGARSRVGGYLFLSFVVAVPELVASGLSTVLPESVTEVLSIPSALAVLRASLAPGHLELLRTGRALLALGVFALLALAMVQREIAALEHAEEA